MPVHAGGKDDVIDCWGSTLHFHSTDRGSSSFNLIVILAQLRQSIRAVHSL